MNKRFFVLFLVIGATLGLLLASGGDKTLHGVKDDLRILSQKGMHIPLAKLGFDRAPRPIVAQWDTEDVLYDLPREGFASAYLKSYFAQSRYDWKAASEHLDTVIATDPMNKDLLRRSMILGMGNGDTTLAVERATELVKQDPGNSFAFLILAVGALSDGDSEAAQKYLDEMPEGDIASFAKPMLEGWTHAAKGKFYTDDFNVTTVHLYNEALIALYLGKKDRAVDAVEKIFEMGHIGSYDAERAANIYALAGMRDQAVALYESSMLQEYDSPIVNKKIEVLKSGLGTDGLKSLMQEARITTVAEGAAITMHDMARILYQEDSDSSARIFVQMALALSPEFEDARLLLANSLARNGRYEEAIEYFLSVDANHPSYTIIQRYVADLYQEGGMRDQALALLNHLFNEYDDIDALIRVGDIYRADEDYEKAIKAYNKAARHIGDDIPEEYWHLLYARGMAYEREGVWEKAETDLVAALEYRPDHPYLLNYLGYGWADQGMKLEESLELIERASALRPNDAYIADSLGWVLYRMDRYQESIPHLETAVELLPYDPTLNDHLGDAYWQVGRRLEARFQWRRAINNADDMTLVSEIEQKLDNGLQHKTIVREAKTDIKALEVETAP